MIATIDKSILIVESNTMFCEGLVKTFRSANYNVFTASTGEDAFLLLRRQPHCINWLYSRAVLPGLIDGWVLADQYHEFCPNRQVVIAAHDARFTAQGDIVLKEPTVAIVAETIWALIRSEQLALTTATYDLGEHRRVA
ncbi:response regulator [Microvirga yunnanensis]|uniref:response regulator n=1 Tax=Microvirga yunnanensis TaxID=2953740 RepID=UPI0021CA2278|nr:MULTISPECIES: response regulator [unclassified Microvirga]